MAWSDERVRGALSALETLLERRARAACEDVSHYPTPIARCDLQLPAVIEQRDHYVARLRAIRADDLASLLAGRAWPQDEEEQALVVQLETAVCAEEARLISLGTRRLAMTASGHGAPVVVLETGLGAESEEWRAVQRALSVHARVCRYDRAGRGASDAAVAPRRPAELVADLHALLRRAGLAPPYVLVGHSFGGLLVRLFAQRHRAEVAGAVLVDAMHQDQFEVFGRAFPPPRAGEPEALRETREFWSGGWRDPRSTQEGIDLVAACAQARGVSSLGDLPIHVLTAGTFLRQPLIPDALRPRLQDQWDGLQRSFLRLSSRTTQTRVETSGHFMQREAPQAVVAATIEMLAAVREATLTSSDTLERTRRRGSSGSARRTTC
jgi:pimeloyl-ACP methyl ester carboxylesterase